MIEPRLTSPVVASIIAAICFSLAHKARLPESWKYLFILLGVLAALWAFVTGGDWLLHRFSIYLKSIRQAWHAPTLALANAVASMNRDQLRLFERVGPFESIGYIGSTGMRWMLYTPMGNIPYTWVTEYLEKCMSTYPNFTPQSGIPDSLQRDYIQWFTSLMVNNNMADKSLGNKPAKWSVPIEAVYDKLGLAEE
jgi:hypothetical protein